MKTISAKDWSEIRKAALQKYNLYDSEWEKVYFNEFTGGYNVYHKAHNFSKKGGGGEAEKIVGKMLAKFNGKQVDFLPETGFKKSPDIKFDNQTWDIKLIDNANEETIRKAIRDARKAQNAIFYWHEHDKLEMLISAVGREAGYFNNKNKLREMPNIYYMDNGVIKLLWSK